MALGLRAEELRTRVLQQLDSHAEPAVVPSLAYDEHRRARILFGTLLIARWLVTGEAAGEDEAAWISRGGEMGAAEGVSMAKSTRGYYFWRDGVLDTLREEAARLHSPPGLLELALEMTRASCDASLLRMSRAYDHRLRTMNSELREASLLRSEFLARMTHELLTPLSAIIGFSELLLEGIDGQLNSAQRDYVELVRESGRSLLSLINDILDPSRIEGGKPADLNAGAGRTARSPSHQAAAPGR